MEKLIYNVNEERREITSPVTVPDEYDFHNHIADEETILQACRDFNVYCKSLYIDHEFAVSEQTAEFVESYITPADMIIDRRLIPRGTWMATMKIYNDSLWQDIKDEKFTGFSLQCTAKVELTNE